MALDRSCWTVAVLLVVGLTLWSYRPLQQAGWVYEDRPLAPSAIDWSTLTLTPRVGTVLSYRVQAGAPASDFHRVNLAVHVASGLVLSALVPMTTLGLTALVLFLLHPINSEAVSYISARADLWMGIALLLTLLAQRIREPLARYGVTLLGLAGAVAAKETGVMALGLVMVWCRWQRRSFSMIVAVLVLAYGGWMSLRFLNHLGTWTPPPPETWRFLGLQSAAIWRLFALLVPVGFTPDHHWAAVPPALGLVSFLGLIATTVTAWTYRQAWPRLSFAVVWAFVALLPRLLVPTQIGLMEHHIYLAGLGLWLSPAQGRI